MLIIHYTLYIRIPEKTCTIFAEELYYTAFLAESEKAPPLYCARQQAGENLPLKKDGRFFEKK